MMLMVLLPIFLMCMYKIFKLTLDKLAQIHELLINIWKLVLLYHSEIEKFCKQLFLQNRNVYTFLINDYQ